MAKQIRNALRRGYELDGYRIQRKIAAGGFGITYLAKQLAFDRNVAIKEYMPTGLAFRTRDGAAIEPRSRGDVEDYEYGLAKFREEGEMLVSFEHPNIVTVHDFREANGTAYLVMQHVEGKNLQDLLFKNGTLSEEQIRKILDPLLDGLEEIHRAGILHRDIKPANIIIQKDCTPVLVDFGAARCAVGRKGKNLTSIVTVGYTPIEQYSNSVAQGPWTDIYALGATLYQAISGINPPAALDRIVEDGCAPAREVAGADYSPALLLAIDRALAVKPGRRPQSIREFRALLDAPATAGNTLVPAGWSQPAVRKPPANPIRPRPSTRLRSAIAAVLLTASMIGGYAVWSDHQQTEALRIAAEQARQTEERIRRESAQRREVARWHRVAAELDRRQAAEQARRRAIEQARRQAAEAARRKASEAAQRRAIEVAQREARGRAAERSAADKRSEKPKSLLGGVQSFFQNLLPR